MRTFREIAEELQRNAIQENKMINLIYDSTVKEFKSFKEYFLLSEAIKPSKTNYGLDKECKNKKISEQGIYFTGFYHKDSFYVVMINSEGVIGFAPGTYSTDANEIFNSLTDERQNSKSYTSVFNEVFYVLLEMLDALKITEVQFEGADKRLDKMYSFLVQNKNFLRYLEEAGYEYIKNTEFKFRRTGE
jgi:hypothetical protein